jgi:inosine/xanthosine triphosphatase
VILAFSVARKIIFTFASLGMKMSKVIRIAVGSKNPVKISAALAGFEAMFPGQAFTAEGYSVASGVSDQPMSCRETLQGATNRADALVKSCRADYFVGIEGGIEVIDGTMFAGAWIVVIDSQGNVARGRSGSFSLPDEVQQLVESGVELGIANDQVFDKQNSKHAGGAVGSLTNGVISRQSLYEHAVALTLADFRNHFSKPEIS